ncbi:cytochrome bd-I oxidase subunit CydX [Jeongeupia naejangsanensis]|uniref:Cytochrome bd-I oxidase subunit CydX n=1 Tax=Jeongeupia naejangsanensis TaxID=613195 RepID=A0ABS2BHX3_9NEIS|nr:cytochrome bd-I oxidase subunit CydX [Jeongeupia naejangsanensis]
MWYFAWILGLAAALAFGIINVMWLESHFAFRERYEDKVNDRFKDAQGKRRKRKQR